MHPNEFGNDVESYLPGIAAKHRAIVKRYQPCEWGASKDVHPFAVLTRLEAMGVCITELFREIEPTL